MDYVGPRGAVRIVVESHDANALLALPRLVVPATRGGSALRSADPAAWCAGLGGEVGGLAAPPIRGRLPGVAGGPPPGRRKPSLPAWRGWRLSHGTERRISPCDELEREPVTDRSSVRTNGDGQVGRPWIPS